MECSPISDQTYQEPIKSLLKLAVLARHVVRRFDSIPPIVCGILLGMVSEQPIDLSRAAVKVSDQSDLSFWRKTLRRFVTFWVKLLSRSVWIWSGWTKNCRGIVDLVVSEQRLDMYRAAVKVSDQSDLLSWRKTLRRFVTSKWQQLILLLSYLGLDLKSGNQRFYAKNTLSNGNIELLKDTNHKIKSFSPCFDS